MGTPRLPRRATKRLRAPNNRADWPRVGATVEDSCIVIRELEDGETPPPVLRRAVRVAEPDAQHPTLADALRAAGESLAESLRKRGAQLPVVVRIG